MNGFRWSRVWAIGVKEVAHISRDPFTWTMALVLPMIVVFIFGIAIEFNMSRIPIAVVDSSKSASSRAFMETMSSSNYFEVNPSLRAADAFHELQGDRVRAIAVIPPNFEKEVLTGGSSRSDVQIIIDGSDGSVVSSILGYLGKIQVKVMKRLLGLEVKSRIDVRTRFLFNPELNSKWFVVPGLVVVILALLSVLLTALTIAREWENGSMEQLLATPVKPLEIMLGKLGPYALLGLASVVIVYFLARVVFNVPFAGSHIVFLAGTLLFLFTSLAQGLLISIATRKQTLAMQIAIISGLLPVQLLSGFIFPIESMPTFFRYFTAILPARWFMNIIRDSFLKNSSFWDLHTSFGILVVMTVIFISVSLVKFKSDLEP